MEYHIEFLENKPLVAASMKMTIPDHSTDLALRAVKTIENELKNKGINLIEPNYNFLIAYDSEYRLEVIDIEIVVCVEKKGEDTDMIRFIDLPNDQEIIRIVAQDFETVHIGLAEWMHDHDYVADGILRAVIHEDEEFIYDCPIKPAED